MPARIQPNGKIEWVRPAKNKSKGDKHDSRGHNKIADLQRQLEEVEEQNEEQKDHFIIQYQSLKELKRQAVEDAKAWKRAADKYKGESEETQDNYNDLQARFRRQNEEIKQKDKVIQRRESEIRSKDKELDDLRVEKKVQNATIKKLEDQDAALRDKVSLLTDEKRRVLQEVSLLKTNEERQLAEIKKLKEENTRLRNWVEKERQLAIEKEATLRREEIERREAERREAEHRAQRRRFNDDYYR